MHELETYSILASKLDGVVAFKQFYIYFRGKVRIGGIVIDSLRPEHLQNCWKLCGKMMIKPYSIIVLFKWEHPPTYFSQTGLQIHGNK